MGKLSVRDLLAGAPRGQKILVRVDYNVPQDDLGKITDDTRMRETIPTLRLMLDHGATPILMSHLGRPKGKPDAKYSLKPVAERLHELFPQVHVALAADVGGTASRQAVADSSAGSLVLLENLRFDAGEEKNDAALAKNLAALGAAYVNDAFGASHRRHASVVAVAELHRGRAAMGLLMQKELDAYERILAHPAAPFIAVLGGAKVSDKLGVVNHLIDRCQTIVIGGAMAYTFLKADGIGVGKSLVEEELVPAARDALARARDKAVEIALPTDHVIARAFDDAASAKDCALEIPEGWLALDIGPRTRERYVAAIKRAKTIAWNGPMGVFENERFAAGTHAVAKAIVESGAKSYAGGGDTVAAITRWQLEKGITHISTGGGASLELMEGKTLPGVAALTSK
ncbi:MAG: phosphoglycerate kinase [Planctomycetota bacterium]